jgi:hypothetical protein
MRSHAAYVNEKKLINLAALRSAAGLSSVLCLPAPVFFSGKGFEDSRGRGFKCFVEKFTAASKILLLC